MSDEQRASGDYRWARQVSALLLIAVVVVIVVLDVRNWRSHPKAQRQALAGVLDQVGFVSPVMVNKRTGRLVDGHLRVELALARGEATVPVSYVDLSPAEEAIVLASLDPLAAMAGVDDEKLRALLADESVDSEALTAMLSALRR